MIPPTSHRVVFPSELEIIFDLVLNHLEIGQRLYFSEKPAQIFVQIFQIPFVFLELFFFQVYRDLMEPKLNE